MKVSVILPNYNHESYLHERIDSILEQTFQDFELIILDDHSSDNSKDIIEKYRNHPKVSQIIYNNTNSGSTFYQWNKGVSLAKADYIWIAESDDVADERLLQTLYDKITEDDDITIAFCQSYRMNQFGEVTGDWLDQTIDIDEGNYYSKDFKINGHEFIKKFLIKKNTIPNASGVLFRKDAFLSVGQSDTSIGYIGDWLMWLKLATIGDIAFSSQRLNYFRYHDKSFAVRSLKQNKKIEARINHLNFRLTYHQFLKKKHQNKALIKLSIEKLEDDLFTDLKFLFVHRKTFIILKYYCLVLFYSPNKLSIIKRTFNVIRKYLN